jgi:hypothetical protein
MLKALLGQATWGNVSFDALLILGCSILLFGASTWSLRRQSAVAGAL